MIRAAIGCLIPNSHMSSSLSSLKGGDIRGHVRNYIGVMKGILGVQTIA